MTEDRGFHWVRFAKDNENYHIDIPTCCGLTFVDGITSNIRFECNQQIVDTLELLSGSVIDPRSKIVPDDEVFRINLVAKYCINFKKIQPVLFLTISYSSNIVDNSECQNSKSIVVRSVTYFHRQVSLTIISIFK